MPPKNNKPKPKATDVVNAILDREIKFVDLSQLPLEARKALGNSAMAALANEAIILLLGKSSALKQGPETTGLVTKDILEYGMRHAKDVEELEALRYTLNGAELIREKLEALLFAEPKDVPPENPYSPI